MSATIEAGGRQFERPPRQFVGGALRALAPVGLAALGFAALIGLWAVVATFSPDLPTPIEAWHCCRG